MELLSPTATATAKRTLVLGLKNLRELSCGRMSPAEAQLRAKQTIIAASKGELSIRQASERYLQTTAKTRGLDQNTLARLIEEYHLQGNEKALVESILFGSYEARLLADPALRTITGRANPNTPTWMIEILKDLCQNLLNKEDYSLISRVTKAGQGETVFGDWIAGKEDLAEKKELLGQIRDLDNFIGIEKYIKRVQYLTDVAEGRISPPQLKSLQAPPMIEASDVAGDEIHYLKIATLLALDHLDEITFAAVVGGSAERMKYVDKEGNPLPQATFPFLPVSGKSVFELHADEILALKNLYYLTQRPAPSTIELPYFMMTNAQTDAKIMECFLNHGYFGLGSKNVEPRVIQTLVPVVSADGKWLRKGRYQLNTKPHGHGDFWTLYFKSARQAEYAANIKKFTLVLQGNNPFVFAHLLEFAGIGMLQNADFGFAVCPREAGAPEGSIVMAQNEKGEFSIQNVEYAVMEAFGLKDEADPQTGYSSFPGNLNFLFGRTEALRSIIQRDPFPGELINLQKLQTSYADGKEVKGGRGEAQVQGVAEKVTAPAAENLRTFVMNAARGSNPSSHFDVFKNAPGEPRDTIATCRQNYSDRAVARLLLAGVEVEHTVKKDAGGNELPTSSSVIELTPAFANRQDILNQKISGGKISEGSTLYLSGFHAEVKDLELSGNLEIKVENEIGDMLQATASQAPLIPDPAQAGKYRIQGLIVKNTSKENEHCHITIKGNGELVVKAGTVIEGNFDLIVNQNEKVTLHTDKDKGLQITREQLSRPSWRYAVEIISSPDTLDLFELNIVEKA